MKKAARYFGVLIFVTIYCFAIGRVSTSHVTSVPEHSEKGKHISSVTTDLFSGFVSISRNVSPSQNYPNPSLKNYFHGSGILRKAHEVVFVSLNTQYLSFAKKLLIRHRKADFIFPFHYFW